MNKSPLDVVLCAGCGSIIPPENIVSEEPPATVRQLLDCDHPYDDVADEVDLGAFARAVVRQVELARPVLPEEARLRALLGDLLAVIHRDGGHYVEAHGWEKACADAEALVLAERVAKDL